MKTFAFKISEKDLVNLYKFEKELGLLLKRINPRKEEYTFLLDYSSIKYSPVTTSTGVAIDKLIKAGFKKVIITTKYQEEIKKGPALAFYLDRGQLEIC